jgi:ribose transport system ATP-binding protein
MSHKLVTNTLALNLRRRDLLKGAGALGFVGAFPADAPGARGVFARVRALKARASFIFVSHRLSEVLELSDRIYVMKDGAVVAELQAAEVDVKTLHRPMVGRGLQAEYYREPLQRPYRDDVVLELEGLGHGDAYRDVSLKLHAGEILGIAGVMDRAARN